MDYITLQNKDSLELIDEVIKDLPADALARDVSRRDASGTHQALQAGNDISYISAVKDYGLDHLKERIWETLGFINVYLVRLDEEPNFNSPIVMKKGASLFEVAQKIGPDFAEERTHAKIWAIGSKFPGQEVSLSLQALDGMQVRFI